MYIKEVKNIIDRYYSKWTKRLSEEMINDIKDKTIFLNYKNPSLKERAYYYIRSLFREDVCFLCGKILKFHNKLTDRKIIYCSSKCANIANAEKIQISINKNNFRKDINDKRKKTCLEKYGVEHVWQDKKVRQKCKDTCVNKYGFSINFQDKKFIEDSLIKKKQKYGEHFEKIVEKTKNTNLEKYGYENIYQIPEIKRYITIKKNNTYKKRYFEKIKQSLINFAKIQLNETYETFLIKNENYNCQCLICGIKFTSQNWSAFSINDIPCVCRKHISNSELEIFNWLKSLNLNIIQSDRSIISPLELDIFLPDFNLAIEFNGLYWHSELFKDKKYHLNKTNLCKEKNIQLIHIFENEWENSQGIVKSIILSKLGIYQQRVYARKCIIKEIDNNIYRDFVQLNHIQGYVPSKIKLGLYYNDELVQICSFGKNRFKKNEIELIRSCTKLNIQVVGGFSKLIQYFVREYKPEVLISYVDLRYFDGHGYSDWEVIGQSGPNYFYWNRLSMFLESRVKYQKHKLGSLLKNFDENKSEVENMIENGFIRIFDCGNIKYQLILNETPMRIN